MQRPRAPLFAFAEPSRAMLGTIAARMASEWRSGPIHRLSLARPRPSGLAAKPRDFRPPDAVAGGRLLSGVFTFAGETLDAGRGGDPWVAAAPSRRFAVALHGFDWAGDLLGEGEAGAREFLRLWIAWRRQFGAYNAFAWTGAPLERRVFHLACAAAAILPLASDAEGAGLLDGLARQARHLAGDPNGPDRAAERAASVALAGAALAGTAGERLLT
ncbi:MAG: heparinase, partial [Caulobacteraceae bacterium]